jgi:N-acetylmuramoyl-L-alanine amidase
MTEGNGRFRLGRRGLIAGAAGIILPGLAEAAAQARLGAAQGETRLTLPIGPGIAWRVSATLRPARLVVELPNQRWHGPDRLAGAGIVTEARREGSGGSQTVILALAGPIAAPQVTLARGLLVIRPPAAAGDARCRAWRARPGDHRRPGHA